jgi:plasmid stabilization system protein ParE
MASDYKIFWTNEAINNLESILNYLSNNWTQREIENFKNRLSKQIRLIQQNPYLFPISHYNYRLRKAVLSKQVTIFYELSGQIIYLVYLFNNQQDIERIK